MNYVNFLFLWRDKLFMEYIVFLPLFKILQTSRQVYVAVVEQIDMARPTSLLMLNQNINKLLAHEYTLCKSIKIV